MEAVAAAPAPRAGPGPGMGGGGGGGSAWAVWVMERAGKLPSGPRWRAALEMALVSHTGCGISQVGSKESYNVEDILLLKPKMHSRSQLLID